MLYNPYKKISNQEYIIHDTNLSKIKLEVIDYFNKIHRPIRFSEKDSEGLSINTYFQTQKHHRGLFTIYLNEDEEAFSIQASLSKDIDSKRYILRLFLMESKNLNGIDIKELIDKTISWADLQEFNRNTWEEFELK
jgi:hypothetical protein